MIVSIAFAYVLFPAMYWADSYWGGALAAAGGALVLLAVGIFRKRQTAFAGVTFAAGVLFLFWTRPFEGGVFTLAVLAVFAREIWRNRHVPMFSAALLVMAAGGAWSCYYNQAITGDPFLLPYMLQHRQYEVAPIFWFLSPRPEPQYDTPRLEAEFGTGGWQMGVYKSIRRGWASPFVGAKRALGTLEPLILLGLPLVLLIPFAWDDPVFVKMVMVGLAVFTALSLETGHNVHYGAPVWAAAALMMAIWVERALRPENHKRWQGAILAILLLAWLGPPVFQSLLAQYRLIKYGRDRSSYESSYPYRRAALIRGLSALSQPQLVFVHYPAPSWKIGTEWVYNGASIDQEKVVFAHDLGAEKDKALLAYYPDRTAWLLTFDPVTGQDKLGPYPRDFVQHH